MAEIKSDRFPAQLPRLLPGLHAVLFYGPDAGLVAELANMTAKAVIGVENDPFRSVELTSKQVRDDPAVLADEAAAIALTGGRRVLRLKEASNDLAGLLGDFLVSPPGDGLLVVEAGDLPKRAALVQIFSKAGDVAAVVPCYRDEGGGLTRFAEGLLKEEGLEADPQALALLSRQLGGDRQLSRREVEKLILYKGGDGGRVEVEDVAACIGDSAALDLEELALAVAEGETAALDRILRRSLQQGANAVQVLRQVLRHFQRLHIVAGQLAEGTGAEAAMSKLQPRPFWKVAKRFEAQARRWPPHRLSLACARLLEAEAACKRTGTREDAYCGQVLLGIALTAPKARR